MQLRLATLGIGLLVLLASGATAFAAVEIEDGRGRIRFQTVPQRVVVLNWDLLEQLLALDVVPIAAPNLAGYQQWVVNPPAPVSIEEIGTRAEPNLEKIASLEPDVIIAASPQQDLLPILERIAPVVYLPNFSEHDDAARTAIEHFLTLAELFNKQTLAEQKLDQLSARFSELKQRIQSRFTMPLDVVVMRFSSPNSVFLSTENSTIDYVTEKLGLNNPIKVAPRAWGIKQTRVNRLQDVESGYVLYLLPFPAEEKLQHSRLWQAMPFVRQGRVNSVRAVWSYGGAMSLQYMAEAIADSLLALSPQS